MAGGADIPANGRNFPRPIASHLRFPVFAAGRTIDSAKSPFMRTEHANQRLFGTITFAAQHSHDRSATAKWAGRWCSIDNRNFAVLSKIFGVRLKKNPRQRPVGGNRTV